MITVEDEKTKEPFSKTKLAESVKKAADAIYYKGSEYLANRVATNVLIGLGKSAKTIKPIKIVRLTMLELHEYPWVQKQYIKNILNKDGK